MPPTPYPEINHLLQQLLIRMQEVLSGSLAGLYLYGSLVWGDFDFEISDIDLLVAVSTPVDEAGLAELKEMHDAFAKSHPVWENRIEVAYISLDALRTLKSLRCSIAVISPGEPLNLKEAGTDWLINGYLVREKGRTLFGPPPARMIEPISKPEFVEAVRRQTAEWRDWVIHTRHSRPYQGYAILTLCRALYVCSTGEQPSKKQAARWAMEQMPEWEEQIQKAIRWRDDSQNYDVDHEATYPETEKFVKVVSERIEKLAG